jgi:hypothetical protein
MTVTLQSIILLGMSNTCVTSAGFTAACSAHVSPHPFCVRALRVYEREQDRRREIMPHRDHFACEQEKLNYWTCNFPKIDNYRSYKVINVQI